MFKRHAKNDTTESSIDTGFDRNFCQLFNPKIFPDDAKEFFHSYPAVGTGNLLTTILNQLNCPDIRSYGVEIDDLLIRLAYVNANLQNHPLELYRQDSLRPLFC